MIKKVSIPIRYELTTFKCSIDKILLNVDANFEYLGGAVVKVNLRCNDPRIEGKIPVNSIIIFQ